MRDFKHPNGHTHAAQTCSIAGIFSLTYRNLISCQLIIHVLEVFQAVTPNQLSRAPAGSIREFSTYSHLRHHFLEPKWPSIRAGYFRPISPFIQRDSRASQDAFSTHCLRSGPSPDHLLTISRWSRPFWKVNLLL